MLLPSPEPAVLLEEWRKAIARFDVRHATAHDPADREMLLMTIEAGFGSHERFNAAVSGILSRVVVEGRALARGVTATAESAEASSSPCVLNNINSNNFVNFNLKCSGSYKSRMRGLSALTVNGVSRGAAVVPLTPVLSLVRSGDVWPIATLEQGDGNAEYPVVTVVASRRRVTAVAVRIVLDDDADDGGSVLRVRRNSR